MTGLEQVRQELLPTGPVLNGPISHLPAVFIGLSPLMCSVCLLPSGGGEKAPAQSRGPSQGTVSHHQSQPSAAPAGIHKLPLSESLFLHEEGFNLN